MPIPTGGQRPSRRRRPAATPERPATAWRHGRRGSHGRRCSGYRAVTAPPLRCDGPFCDAVGMTIAFTAPHFRPADDSPRVRLDLTYGIEEEFFLVDAATRALVQAQPPGFLRECRLRLPERVG